tara:strand:+ start:415 stop:534 length:120 start_codon:yes stop_codon:yes gene_type:complete
MMNLKNERRQDAVFAISGLTVVAGWVYVVLHYLIDWLQT